MTKTRLFPPVIILLSVFISLSAVSCTKKPEKKYVIAIINPNPQLNDVVRGFKNKMSEYGYVQGGNTTYMTINNLRDIDLAMPEFRQNKVDLIYTLTTPATMKAKNVMELTGIPVVFGTSYDPVKGGIVKRLAYQAENITGIKVGGSTQKALEWLLKIAPKVKRIFVPVKIDTEAATLSLAELKEAG
jgi:putative ABC transport system substrate-binding protein